jgi:hypothetical protein
MRTMTGRSPSLCIALLGSLLLSTACARSAPERTADPHQRLEIVGDIPQGIAIELTAEWVATVIDDTCAPKVWPAGVRLPKLAKFSIPLGNRSGTQATWTTWWDLLVPGECGWRLAGIDFFADRSASAMAAHKGSIAPNRIAFACIGPCGVYPRANDDSSQPALAYCKFSILKTDGTINNPCVYTSTGAFFGPNEAPFKEQHMLRPGQQLIRFAVTDVETTPADQQPPRGTS